MANNSPNLAKCINLQIQEAEENSNWINPNKSTPKHILNFQKLKTQQNFFKITKEKGLIFHKERPIQMMPDFSLENMEAKGGQATFPSFERKEMLTMNSISGKIIFQE